LCVLDNGAQFEPEEFQLVLVEDLFAGHRENWWVIPEGNGKTTFLGHLGLYYGDFTPSAMIPIAASSREQAEIMYRQAEGFVIRTPGLRERFKCQEGYRRIKCLRTGGRLQVYAADDRTGDGIIPGGVALVDELHRHRDLRLYRTWVGKLVKRDAQIVAISTGGEPGAEFEETRQRIHDTAESREELSPCHFRAAADGIVLHDFRVPDREAASDMDVVAAANPRSDLTAEVLRKKREAATMTEAHWLRFVCNLPFELDGTWLPAGAWDECFEAGASIPDGSSVIAGVDIGLKKDTTAISLVWCRADGRFVVRSEVFTPPGDGQSLQLEVVEHRIRELCGLFDVEAVVYDPWSFERSAQMLSDEGVLMVEFPQRPERMSNASIGLYEAIVSRQLVHDGDRVLAAHVMAGHQKMSGERWRLAKNPKAKRPIDALMALVMAFDVARRPAQDHVVEVW
jgi:phage terminase large subunit-like protein